MSVFEKTRAQNDQYPVLKYVLLAGLTVAAIYFIGWRQSFMGVLFAVVVCDMIVLNIRLQDRATYLVGFIPFLIAAILAYAIEWQHSSFNSHFRFFLIASISAGWALKYRKALSHKQSTA